MDEEHLARLRALIEAESTLTLATVGEDGAPQAAPVFYVPDGELALCWVSARHSRHSRNVERTGRAAASIHASTFDWAEIRGAQLEGRVSIVEGAERERILAAYRARFRLADGFDAAIERSALYSFEPDWIRYLDNGVAFGFKAERRC